MPIGQKTITGSKVTPPGVTSTPVTSVGGSVTAEAGPLALESGGNLAAVKSNTDTIKTNTTGLALESGGNLAGAKTDLDSIKQTICVSAYDTISNSIVAISHSHEEIHAQKSYTISMVSDILATNTLYCQITAPDTAIRCHWIMGCNTSVNGITITLYESPTTSGGTSVTAYNRDRNSSNTATATVVHTPTVTATGTTILFSTHLDASKFGSGGERAITEWILKQNTKYLIAITADAAGTATFSGKMDWYEI